MGGGPCPRLSPEASTAFLPEVLEMGPNQQVPSASGEEALQDWEEGMQEWEEARQVKEEATQGAEEERQEEEEDRQDEGEASQEEEEASQDQGEGTQGREEEQQEQSSPHASGGRASQKHSVSSTVALSSGTAVVLFLVLTAMSATLLAHQPGFWGLSDTFGSRLARVSYGIQAEKADHSATASDSVNADQGVAKHLSCEKAAYADMLNSCHEVLRNDTWKAQLSLRLASCHLDLSGKGVVACAAGLETTGSLLSCLASLTAEQHNVFTFYFNNCTDICRSTQADLLAVEEAKSGNGNGSTASHDWTHASTELSGRSDKAPADEAAPDASRARKEKPDNSLDSVQELETILGEQVEPSKSPAGVEEGLQKQHTVTPEAAERVDMAKWWLCGFITSGILFAFSTTHLNLMQPQQPAMQPTGEEARVYPRLAPGLANQQMPGDEAEVHGEPASEREAVLGEEFVGYGSLPDDDEDDECDASEEWNSQGEEEGEGEGGEDGSEEGGAMGAGEGTGADALVQEGSAFAQGASLAATSGDPSSLPLESGTPVVCPSPLGSAPVVCPSPTASGTPQAHRAPGSPAPRRSPRLQEQAQRQLSRVQGKGEPAHADDQAQAGRQARQVQVKGEEGEEALGGGAKTRSSMRLRAHSIAAGTSPQAAGQQVVGSALRQGPAGTQRGEAGGVTCDARTMKEEWEADECLP